MKVIVDNLDWTSLLDSVEESLMIIDAEGRVLLFNDSAGQLHLFDPPIQSGAILFDSIPLQRRDFIRRVVRDVLQSQKTHFTNADYSDSTGKTFYFEIRYSPIMDGADVNQVFIEARDVTQQKIFENKITTVASELSSLIENANAVIIGIDTQGYITEWNEMSSRITGYTKNDALTQVFSDLLIDKGHRLDFSLHMKEILSAKLISNYELPVIARDGRKLILLINATPRKNASGQVIGILVVGQDITELSEYRKTLERKVDERTMALQASIQKEKELVDIKNRFIATASHEFKSPLSSIHYDVEWIKANLEKLSTEEKIVKLDQIQSRVRRMSVMLEDLLTIGKSDAGKLRAHKAKVELKSFFQKIIRDVEINTKSTHAIRLDFPQPALEIESDEKLMRNIFINLLNNAIKFSPGENEIFLSIAAEGPSVVMRIRDKGIGIDEKDLQTIFEPFTRGRNAEQIKGTGLGLSIVKKAVETIGGKMTVESQIGKGTEFKITLDVNGQAK